MNKSVCVRFAPSPTGVLHLGGARTAIYNWLFARANSGKFLLRIEDTDVERSKVELVDQICDSLMWLGVSWEEEPIFQSARLSIYKRKVEELLNTAKAYRCFCSPEELKKGRERAEKEHKAYRYNRKCRNLSSKELQRNLDSGKSFAVRFKINEGITKWNDIIYGRINVQNSELDDFIIQRSNGIPTYQLAVVVDDIDMGITHVIRGEDHVPNTPKQINLFKAFGRPIPEFAHLPLLQGTDGKRLSKRHGATGVDEYRAQGFPSEAIFNYLALLGWTPKSGQEILDIPEIITQFSLEAISRKGAIFDSRKLEWISGQHISQASPDKLFETLAPLFEKAGLIAKEEKVERRDYIFKVIKILQTRMKTYNQFIEWGGYFFKDPENYDRVAVKKNWMSKEVNLRMDRLYTTLEKCNHFDESSIEKVVRDTADSVNIKAAFLIHPLRLALTGLGIGPGLFEIVKIIGKEAVLRRIRKACRNLPI